MSSPFSMLGLISKSRRATQKRVPTVEKQTIEAQSKEANKVDGVRKDSQPPQEKTTVDSAAEVTRDSTTSLISTPLATPPVLKVSNDNINSFNDHLGFEPLVLHRPTTQEAPDQGWTEVNRESDWGEKNAIVVMKDKAGSLEDLSNTQAHSTSLENEMAEMTKRIKFLESDIAEMREGDEKKDAKIQLLHSENASHLADSQRLNDELKAMAEKERVAEGLEARKREVEAELHRVREIIKEERRTHKEEVDSVERHNALLSTQIHRSYEELAATREDLEVVKGVLQSLQSHNAGLVDELKTLRALAEEAKEETAALHKNGIELMKQRDDLHQKLDAALRRNRMLEDQMDRQSTELRSLKHPTNRHDSAVPTKPVRLTDHQLTTMITALNNEIFQAAAYMADSLDLSVVEKAAAERENNHTAAVGLSQTISNVISSSLSIFQGAGFTTDSSDLSPIDEEEFKTRDVSESIKRMSEVLGSQMILILRSVLAEATAEFDLLPIQIALQACIVYCSHRVITSWYPGHWEYGDFLKTIFVRIQGAEDQTTCEKWRNVTQAQWGKSTEVQGQMSAFMTEYVMDVLAVAGWTIDVHLATMFRERLETIAKMALFINTTITGSSDSGRWEPTIVEPGAVFDPELMEDAFDGLSKGIESAMCTTEMGLRGLEETVLKPKVVLRSVLEVV